MDYDKIKTETLLDCLPQNIPLYKDSGLWMFRSDNLKDVLLTQGVYESLRDFVIRFFKQHERNTDVIINLSIALSDEKSEEVKRLRWIKCNDRLPEKRHNYHVRVKYQDDKPECWNTGAVYNMSHWEHPSQYDSNTGMPQKLKVYEWLDETPEQSPVSDAVAFADWMDRYMNNPPVGELASNAELYSIFLSQSPGDKEGQEGWSIKKPETECVFVSATKYDRNNEPLEWDYKVWQIIKLDGENDEGESAWYYGLLNGDGEEWGPLEDLQADLYFVLINPYNQII